jgi:L-fucose isomerase-like protein
MREAAALFRETDVDLMLVLFCSWVPEHILVQLTNELLHLPVLLWAVNQPDQLVSPCGLLSAASNFKKQGTSFFHILGDPNPETLAKIETVARSCTIAKRLRQSRIGIVGYPPSGMIDVTFSEADILTLGPVLIHIDTLDLLRTSEHVDQSCVEKEVASVRDSGWRVEIPEDELSESVMMYCGLKTLVREYDLSAIGVRCWPELREERKVPVCFGLACLSDEGIAGFCEGDVNKGVLQTVMQWLTGLPAFLADPSSFDFQSNTMELWHCGALGTKAASNKQEVTIKPNLFSRRGASMCFSFMEGPVTVASLAGPVEGSFNLLACSGVASYGEPESGNQTRIRFEIPLKQLFEEMVENGMGHHLIVGSGNVVEELKCFAMLAGLRFIPQGIQHALNE